MYAPETRAAGGPVREALRAALADLLDGLPPRQAAQAVERLIADYRGRTPTAAPVLRGAADAAAYAAYRMPATFEAIRAALAAFRTAAPDWVPASHTDLGGGTGAAVWAVAAAWPDDTARTTTVLDWSEPALTVGRRLAEGTAGRRQDGTAAGRRQPESTAARGQDGTAAGRGPAGAGPVGLRDARWVRRAVGDGLPSDPTDLVTIGYLLGELTDADRRAVVDRAAAAAQVVLIVEPGTPDGYLRVRQARDRLVSAGLHVLAPCPHSAACPVTPGDDWCHFAARVSRSSLHRQVKGGSLPYEDEKFAYVAAARWAAGDADARVVRHPQLRKGQVLLDLCTPDGSLRRHRITRRLGPAYRAARDTAWGDTWPGSGPDCDSGPDSGSGPAGDGDGRG